jgi:hypothetical protein
MIGLDEQGLARPVLGGQQQGQQAAGLERRRTRHGLGAFGQSQHIGRTKSANFNSFHAF